jgi:hypothetical protein
MRMTLIEGLRSLSRRDPNTGIAAPNDLIGRRPTIDGHYADIDLQFSDETGAFYRKSFRPSASHNRLWR